MVFHWIDSQLPILLAQLDEPLGEPHHVGEVHVGVHHAVQHHQVLVRAEILGEVDRRGLFIRLPVILRKVQNGARVAVVVVSPVGNGPERRAGLEGLSRREKTHEGDEATV